MTYCLIISRFIFWDNITSFSKCAELIQIIENTGASVNIYYTLQFQMIGNEKIIVVEFHSCVECSIENAKTSINSLFCEEKMLAFFTI